MKKQLFSILFLLASICSTAQQKYTISGSIKEKRTGESIIGATLKVVNETQSAASNEYGFYSLSLPAGVYTIEVSCAGMVKREEYIPLNKNISADIRLEENADLMEEITIKSTTGGRQLASTQMSAERLSAKDMKYIPQLFGERDPLKAIQFLPGIKSAGDGNSGIYVRGGSSEQNLILLDEATVYNASHLLGFFSIFNGEAIKDITVYKAGMPAQYGGRLSSVLDIRMNDGNNQYYSVSGGIGLISSKLNLEGPFQKDKSSFLLSGRTTYIDMFLKLSNDSAIHKNGLGFYDLNARMNYSIGKKDKLFFSGYLGNDHLNLDGNFKLNWGNSNGTLRWNHIYNNNIFSNTSLIYSNYDNKITLQPGANQTGIYSQIRDWNLKEELQWNPGNKQRIGIGFNTIYHTIRPGEVITSSGSGAINPPFQKRYSWENALYFSDNWKLNDRWAVTFGARLNTFSILGKGDFYTLDTAGRIIDTKHIAHGKIYKTYFNAEPRVAVSYLVNSNVSIKASYGRNTQNLHLISNSTSSSPTDKWVASTNNIRPEISDQLAMGYYRNFANNQYEFTAETYFKTMQRQVDYRDGADVTDAGQLETQLLYGKGRAYGAELLIKKKAGKLTGWLSYTLSKSEKLIPGINEGKWYNATQDRTHDIAIVAAWRLNKKWTLSANWIYYTGNAVSFPEGKYMVGNGVFFYYTSRNGYRMPDYHRLDLGATKLLKVRKHFSSELTFSLFNAYGRENAYIITFRHNKDDPSKTETVQTSLFSFVPAVSYNFKF